MGSLLRCLPGKKGAQFGAYRIVSSRRLQTDGGHPLGDEIQLQLTVKCSLGDVLGFELGGSCSYSELQINSLRDWT